MAPVSPASTVDLDVVVWGGGTGGVAAAIQAARAGVRTLLLTPGPWLGGMLSSAGVCAPDGHELSCWQTGLWGAFLRGVAEREPTGVDHNWVSCFGFRPATAETLLRDWVAREQQLVWWPDCTLLEVKRKGDQIEQLRVSRGDQQHQIQAAVVVDGSDLGDLLAQAAVPHRWGWEAQEQWDEPSAPTEDQLTTDRFFQDQPIQSPTWVSFGQEPVSDESAQAVADPSGDFAGSLASFGLARTLSYGRLPGGLVMLNWPLQGNDWHQGLNRAISSDTAERKALESEMQAHSLAFLNELQHCSGGWLTPGEGIPGSGSALALMPYWREGRRLIGRATVTEHDLLPIDSEARRGPLPIDSSGRCTSIAVGTYANDHHYPGEDWPLAPKSCRWGGRWTGTPFCISYDALVSEHTSNLLMADKAFSVSHMANGATRLQPLILNIGQAAGQAAALAVQHSCNPAQLPVQTLQHALLKDVQAPAAMLPIWDWPWWHPNWVVAQYAGLDAPERINGIGGLEGSSHLERPDADQAPASPHQAVLEGVLLRPDPFQFTLDGADGTWPLISLEPGVTHWLQGLNGGEHVRLRAIRNPWGPWLRVLGGRQIS